jgi:nucleoside-diphosphate-sugar epimerase
MTRWFDPRWTPADLVPTRLRGTALSTAEIARRAADTAAAWDGRPPPAGEGAAYVLLGGAGFLGARIAAQLLAEPGDAPVVVVSRRPEAILQQGLRPGSPRLILVAADVTAANRDWMGRIPRARTIFHLAATMHALAGWNALAPVNLAGLAAAIALAERDGALVQLASTLSVFVSSNAQRADTEAPLPERDDFWLHGGYAQTKAAAEMVLLRTEHVRWQVVRYGLLVPDAGAPFPPRHFAPAFLHALSLVGAVPDQAERAAVDLTPVNGAARAAIELARNEAPRRRHYANPQSAQLAELVAAIEAVRGPFEICPMHDWLGRLRPLPRIDRALLRSAFDKSGFLAEDAAVSPMLNVDLFQSTLRQFVPPYPGREAPPPPNDLLPGIVRSMLAQGGA